MPSTVIARFSYDAGKEALTIRFLSGRVYVYDGVPQKVYTEMKMAGSKGSFFNLHIKDKYPFKQIE
jgi:hypothetical protein